MLTEELSNLIAEADVVSFDVFDTLLLRRHYLPGDVFAHAGGKYSRRFRLLRVVAEQIARLRHRRQQDVSLAQIYAVLHRSPEHELRAETLTLFANSSARLIYERAVHDGKTIIAVSDMYLPRQFIRESLERAGYDRIDRVYVSCEDGKSKYSGDLFRHVANDLGVAPERILHVGDNAHSDVTRAREQGFRTWHLPSPQARFEAAARIHPNILRYLRRARKPHHSLLLGIFRDGLSDEAPERDYWYRWGFSVAGPVVNAFVDWVRSRYQQGDHTGLYLFARDGDLPRKVLAIRYPEIPAHYTFASRRLFLIPALEQLDKSTLTALCSSLPGTRAHEFWERLGIPNAAVEELLNARFDPEARIQSDDGRQRLEAFFRDAHALMLPDVRRENQALRAYLAEIGFLSPGSRPLIVDVGWRASSQRFLGKAIPEIAGTAGAYFGLSDDAYRNGQMSAWFFDGFFPLRDRRRATSCVEITELIFSAPHPSIRRIASGPDGRFDPVYEPLGEPEENRIAIVRRIHEGAMAFTTLLQERLAAGQTIEITHDDVGEILDATVFRPMPEDLQYLGQLPHALGLGISRYETLLPLSVPANPMQLLMHHLGPSPTRLYWSGGLIRAVEFKHGKMRSVATEVALTGAWAVLVARERLSRLKGK